MTAERQAHAERLGPVHLAILALTLPLVGYTRQRRRRVLLAPEQGIQLSRRGLGPGFLILLERRGGTKRFCGA
jgi:hypothetical protein